jgi:cyclic pyranopterin phosphate synthase
MLVYRFEGIDESLELVPLAARRALDAAGTKLSLAAWRAMTLDLRRAIVALGALAVVDEGAVRAIVTASGAPYVGTPSESDPSPEAVPELLVRTVTDSAWRALTPLDRYALLKVARGKHPEEILPRASAEIAPISTHVDSRGQAHMVDVGTKDVTLRRAVAQAHVAMSEATRARLRAGDVAKGDVLATARIAGIQAAKRTPELIPLCHAIALTRVTVDLLIGDDGVSIEAVAEARDRTGVEMEALTAASVAALTVYDMLKSVDRGMRISVELLEKSGGRSGTWTRS